MTTLLRNQFYELMHLQINFKIFISLMGIDDRYILRMGSASEHDTGMIEYEYKYNSLSTSACKSSALSHQRMLSTTFYHNKQ